MSLLCSKSLGITVTDPLPRCNCPGDPLGATRPRIVGYYDNLLNPLLMPPACTPDIVVPNIIWDGTFPVNTPGFCVWQSDPTVDTVNINHRWGGAFIMDTGAGYWWLVVNGIQGMVSTYVWFGQSAPGTGGVCSTPEGLTFTAVAPGPIFCGCAPFIPTPATLVIEAA